MNKVYSRAGRILALAGITAGLGFGLAASPAEAAADKAVIAITEQPGNYLKVNIDVVFPMTQAQAQQLKNSRHSIVLRTWGEDPASDDLLYGPDTFRAYDVTSRGIELHTYYYFKRGTTLNEDSGVFDGEIDDIYVGARLLNPTGSTIRSARSNTVHGKF